jgi:hypothetical protein
MNAPGLRATQTPLQSTSEDLAVLCSSVVTKEAMWSRMWHFVVAMANRFALFSVAVRDLT